jgi:lipopolysaccharide transport protein LptA
VLYNTTATEQRKTPMQTRSDNLAAHKLERRIDLSGNVKIDDEQRHMTGEKASFYFDANRKMDHVDAEGKITFVDESTGRKGTGDKAIYQVAKRLVFLYGSPATITDPSKGNESGEQIAIDLARNKVEIADPKGTKGTYKPQ